MFLYIDINTGIDIYDTYNVSMSLHIYIYKISVYPQNLTQQRPIELFSCSGSARVPPFDLSLVTVASLVSERSNGGERGPRKRNKKQDREKVGRKNTCTNRCITYDACIFKDLHASTYPRNLDIFVHHGDIPIIHPAGS